MYNAIKFLNKEITGVSSSKREEEVMSMRHEQGMHLGKRAGNTLETPRRGSALSAWSRVGGWGDCLSWAHFNPSLYAYSSLWHNYQGKDGSVSSSLSI